MTNDPSEDKLRVEFNEWASAGRGESMEQGHRPVGEQAIEKMQIPIDARVLDVGCGSGWASRLLAARASRGRVTGIDIADEMIRIARDASSGFANLDYQVASAASLPFADGEFTHAFSMESLYYYADMGSALREIRRVLQPGGLFVTVLDLYKENKPSHQWIEKLAVPVHLLGTADYLALFEQAGFMNVQAERILDPSPIPEEYSGSSFNSLAALLEYRAAGSLMLSGRAKK
jgi:ubiquinone/menaquinone biosynthesis C-methylase UbiE